MQEPCLRQWILPHKEKRKRRNTWDDFKCRHPDPLTRGCRNAIHIRLEHGKENGLHPLTANANAVRWFQESNRRQSLPISNWWNIAGTQ